ncbi:MAG TPA: hypothetical protein VGW78_04140 [Candidatus Babeliales bacterium]|jgi:hypothetical protein|nr:hypothetical protein [Candidatus Babeliales bacterium]
MNTYTHSIAIALSITIYQLNNAVFEGSKVRLTVHGSEGKPDSSFVTWDQNNGTYALFSGKYIDLNTGFIKLQTHQDFIYYNGRQYTYDNESDCKIEHGKLFINNIEQTHGTLCIPTFVAYTASRCLRSLLNLSFD